MNAPLLSSLDLTTPTLHGLALAALDLPGLGEDGGAEATWLRDQREHCMACPTPPLQTWLAAPPERDRALHNLVGDLHLQPVEMIAAALALAVETDAKVGRVLAWLQAPVGGSRPSVGLIVAIAEALGLDASLGILLDGVGRDVGLLLLESDAEPAVAPFRPPLPEQALFMPAPLALALREGFARWPGVALVDAAPDHTAASLREAAARQATALANGDTALAIRAGHPREARTAAILLAEALGGRAALFEEVPGKGAGLWFALAGAIPVLCQELAPGEVRRLPALPGYHGPMLVACGPEGSFQREGDGVNSWRVPLPEAGERIALWAAHTGDAELARHLGEQHRYNAAHIQMLARAASHHAGLDHADHIERRHVSAAARSGLAADLGSLAELLADSIDDAVLIVPDGLREALLALQQRCQARESLADGLGPSARSRYRPGVRALFVGPSGTGKTLAVGWLATRLGLPLYRVDLASVTSKYIGETEKNLAQLFARAEQTEAVLLFDEADSLFGKRTEVRESNDRFANAQTNYLLQRIESFEGITILTSNSRARFDSAFTRRLDAILEFPSPSPEERRVLWQAHLGSRHALSTCDINRLAGMCDLSGGHIRNVVLYAASCARGSIGYADIVAGVAHEYRKLGKQTPAGVAAAAGDCP